MYSAINLKQFANIGNAILIKALGIQENYKEETITNIVDEESTGCYSCKNYIILHSSLQSNEANKLYNDLKTTCQSECDTCPEKVYCKKTIYHNERNKYGYLPRLKANAIKLLLAYHLIGLDNNGVIKNINIKALADLLKCSRKTIINNNATLQKYGYLYHSSSGNDNINIFIPEAKNYYLPANKGGRGYFPISKPLFEELLKCKNLNELRIIIRELIAFNISPIKNLTTTIRNMTDIRRNLPKYCRPNVIRRAVNSITTIFTTNIIEKNIDKIEKVRFRLIDRFNVSIDKENRIKYYKEQFTEFINTLNEEIVTLNSTNTTAVDLKHPELKPYKDKLDDAPYLVRMSELQIYDIASLSLQTSYEDVTSCFMEVYFTYYGHGEKPRNPAGLLRHIINLKYQNDNSDLAY